MSKHCIKCLLVNGRHLMGKVTLNPYRVLDNIYIDVTACHLPDSCGLILFYFEPLLKRLIDEFEFSLNRKRNYVCSIASGNVDCTVFGNVNCTTFGNVECTAFGNMECTTGKECERIGSG